MRIGFTGYLTLSTVDCQPIDNPARHHVLLKDLSIWSGEPVHFFQIKSLRENCHLPDEGCDDNEREFYSYVTHYGDKFRSLSNYVGKAPSQGRAQWLMENPYDWASTGFEFPYLDVLIIEASSQMGSAYVLDEIAKRAYQVNPNVGFLIMDQDMSSTSVRSKIKRWCPNTEERIIIGTYDPTPRRFNQLVALERYIDSREMPSAAASIPMGEPSQAVYVGNDYDRRGAMQEFFGPDVRWYGRCKKDFEPTVRELGADYRGVYVATTESPLEFAYRETGVGLNISRPLYYKNNTTTLRMSEICRSGSLLLVDKKLKIAAPLVGDWAHLENREQLRSCLDYLRGNRQYHEDLFQWQRATMKYYLSQQRFMESIFHACNALVSGPVNGWRLNLYEDICKAAGVKHA